MQRDSRCNALDSNAVIRKDVEYAAHDDGKMMTRSEIKMDREGDGSEIKVNIG